MRFRPTFYDIPMIVWCGVGLFTSMANGLGVWDGVSAVFKTILLWGIPYVLGRAFLRDPAALRDVAMGMLIGAMIYMPLCLYEIRMWTPLHRIIYGSLQDSWVHLIRYGNFRPLITIQLSNPIKEIDRQYTPKPEVANQTCPMGQVYLRVRPLRQTAI